MAGSSSGHFTTGIPVDSAFERSRIEVLKEERQFIQKKTFTKWMNSYLNKVGMNVNDLFTDLADGKLLLKLLEIISGEKIGKPSNGKMRVHKVENLNKSLNFLHTKVRLESIGAEDIVDGNPTLILGLIWTIILRFYITPFEPQEEEPENKEKISAKEALLLWAQRKTDGYKGVKVDNFTSSWKNGLGFNALIHAHRPDLVDYDRLRPDRPLENLNNAFDVAEKHLGVARLLEPEDLLEHPDEKSVMTYVASYWHTFAKIKDLERNTKKIGKIVGSLVEIEKLRSAYEKLASDLLAWINRKTRELSDRSFVLNLESLQQELLKFKDYRMKEKPPRMMERGNIEVAFFDIQTKRKALGQSPYVPPEELSIQVVDQQWKKLEAAEHQREIALREAMIRLERLERLAEKFERKAALRNSWLAEMTSLLSDQKVGKTLAQIDASLKKFEAIKADVQPRDERFAQLASMATELYKEDYHGKERIARRHEDIARKWRDLLELLDKRKRLLDGYSQLIQIIRDAESLYADMKEMEGPLRQPEIVQHLASVQMFIQKHSLTEAELIKIGKKIQSMNAAAPQFANVADDQALLQNSLRRTQDQFKVVVQLAQARRARLDEALSYYQFESDADEEDAWAVEKIRTIDAMAIPKAARQAVAALQKAKLIETEANARWDKVLMLKATAEGLISKNHPNKAVIQRRLSGLLSHWSNLRALSRAFLDCMEAAVEFYQYHSDVDEVESWLKETQTILNGMDPSADVDVDPLLRRLARIEEEIDSFEPDVRRLGDQVDRLRHSALLFGKLNEIPALISPDRERSPGSPVKAETELHAVAAHPFNVNGFDVKKGEPLVIVEKVNRDWWHVRKSDGNVGAAPANHLKEVSSDGSSKPKASQSSPAPRKDTPQMLDPSYVASRHQIVQDGFTQLRNIAAMKRRALADASTFRDFLRDCVDLEDWINGPAQLSLTGTTEEPLVNQQRRYDAFLPEFASRGKQMAHIREAGQDLLERKHSQSPLIKQRMTALNNLWSALDGVKSRKEKDLEYRTRMEEYDEAVKNADEYIYEKSVMMKFELPREPDVAAMKSLTQRIVNSQRELIPIQQMIQGVRDKGYPLRKMYPHEEPYIAKREQALQNEANDLESYLKGKQAELEGDVSHSMFQSALSDFEAWIADVLVALREDVEIDNPNTVIEEQQQHEDLVNQIDARLTDYPYLVELGRKMIAADPASEKEVTQILNQLRNVIETIRKLCVEKREALKYVANLLELSKKVSKALDDINRVGSLIGQEPDTGKSLADVEILLRRQEDLEHDVRGVEDRAKSLLDSGKEIVNKPPNNRALIRKPLDKASTSLLELQDQLRDFSKLWEAMQHRRSALDDSLQYQSWRNDVEDLNQWMKSLIPLLSAKPTEDEIQSEKAYRRHAKQVAEINANGEHIQQLSRDGKNMIVSNHPASGTVAVLLEEMISNWEELTDKAEKRNQKFEHAAKARGFFGNVDKARSRLAQIQASLEASDGADDSADPRKLRTDLKNADTNIKQAEQIVNIVKEDAKLLAAHNPENGPKLLKTAEALEVQLKRLEDPAKRRREQLEAMVKRNQIVFDLEQEISWIDERVKQLKNPNDGKTLDETAALLAKVETLDGEVTAHEPVHKRIVSDGTSLARAYPEISRYANLVEEADEKWKRLVDMVPIRKAGLETIAKGHQYQTEYGDVSDWLEHTLHHLRTEPKAIDNLDGAERALKNMEAYKLDFVGERAKVDDLDRRAKELIQNAHPDSKSIANFQRALKQKADDVEDILNARSKDLKGSVVLIQFVNDCKDLEDWMEEQIRVAENPDCGIDLETLKVSRDDFNNFQKRAEDLGARRLKKLEAEAEMIRKQSPSSEAEVDRHMTILRGLSEELKDGLGRKQELLGKTADIFAFDAAVNACIERIEDAMMQCFGEPGKDLGDVQRKLAKQDEVAQEIKAIGAAIEPIKEESMRLIEEYPGRDAEHVSALRQILGDKLDSLKKASAKRRADLLALIDYFKWQNEVKDYQQWASDIIASLAPSTDKASKELLIKELDDSSAELLARQPRYEALLAECDRLSNLLPEKKIGEDLDQLKMTHQTLVDKLSGRRKELRRELSLEKLLRELGLLETRANSHESILQSHESPELTADQLRRVLAYHHAFEKIVEQQMDKLAMLEHEAADLINMYGVDPRRIMPRFNDVAKKCRRVEELTKERTKHLNGSLAFVQFKDFAEDVEDWIEGKIRQITARPLEDLSFDEKVPLLIKHQTFEAEMNSNATRVEQVRSVAEGLVKDRNERKDQVVELARAVQRKWEHLQSLAADRTKALEDARDMVSFQTECDLMEKWMREKSQMLAAEDLGRDLEHCLQLQKKLDDVGSDVSYDESRIALVNSVADKLTKSGVGKTEAVNQRRKDLNDSWERMKRDLQDYRAKLKVAKELHTLEESLDDTREILLEKSASAKLSDPRDVDEVAAVIRKHESFARDLDGIHGRIENLDKEVLNAYRMYPTIVQKFRIETKMSGVREAWNLVNGQMNAEKEHLKRLSALLKFLKEVQEFVLWSESTQTLMRNTESIDDMSDRELERLTEGHNDLKAKIQNREKTLNHLIQEAKGLQSEATEEGRISPGTETVDQLRRSWDQVNTAWEKRARFLQQCQQYLAFNHQADETEAWLGAKEAFLANEDLGHTMSEVESILRKHTAFENAVQMQSDKVADITALAKKLVADEHFAASDIEERAESVATRLANIRERTRSRSAQLEQSERYQQYLKSLSEFSIWLEGKFQLLSDESWKEPVHLDRKLQKQDGFEKELSANQGRLDSLILEGEQMIGENHFAASEIARSLDSLKRSWNELVDGSDAQRNALLELQRVLKLSRRIDDFATFLDGVESFLNADDIGSNLSGCLKLAERCETVKNQIDAETPMLNELKEQTEVIATGDNPLKNELLNKFAAVNGRYEKLPKLVNIRMMELEDAQKLHQFYLEYHELMLWFKEKQAQMESRDAVNSVSEAQSLLKKIIQLEEEVADYHGPVQHATEAGYQLMAADTSASDVISKKVDELRDGYQELKKQCADRRQLMEDTVDAQKFYADVNELESLFAPKKILLESNSAGDDEDSTKMLLKKLDAVERDIHGFSKSVEKLADTAQSFKERQHADAVNLQRRFEGLRDRHRELLSLLKHRRQQLNDNLRLLAFSDDCAALMAVLREKMEVAESEDYGNDVEHVDLLIQKFVQFQKDLSIVQIRVKNINDKALQLCNEGHAQVQQIKAKIDEVNVAWSRLQDLTNSRYAALQGAREVHVLVRDIDEALEWIHEKSAVIASEDYNQDLDAVQPLIRRHEGFQRDLIPFGERVAQLNQTAGGLAARFPDAQQHIDKKYGELDEAWKQLVEKSNARRARLLMTESLQNYLNKYREFSLWVSEMMAILTSYELPQDAKRAEALIIRHKEHRADIESRRDDFNQIKKEGIQIIQQKHLMSEEIHDKLARLEKGYENLGDIWKKRNDLYALNLDIQIFYRDCQMLNNWLLSQEPILRDENLGDSVQAVEDLLKKHEDFQKMVENQESRFNLVRRLTELEKAYAAQKSREEEMREEDRARREADKENSPTPSRRGSIPRAASFTPASGKKMASALRPSPSVLSNKDKQTVLGRMNTFSTKQREGSSGSLDQRTEQKFPVEIEGTLERKQELEADGEKATSRSWKTYHTVLIGQLLCFFKKRQPSYDRGAAAPPLNLHECLVSKAHDYRKKEHVFRLHLRDGSEYLFAADDENKMNEWISKLQFHAALPPNLQLMSYDEGMKHAAETETNGDNAERTLEYARSLSRSTPSPAGPNRENAPVPKPRAVPRTKSPLEESYGNGTNGRTLAESLPEEEPAVEITRGSNVTLGRSESLHYSDEQNGHNERGIDVEVQPRAVSSLALGQADAKKRGATLPTGFGKSSPEFSSTDSGKLSEKRGSKGSIFSFMRKKHDK